MKDLPKWQSHKIVRAAMINSIIASLDGSWDLFFINVTISINVEEDYIKKHQPKVGGYYVLYEDGYESWSPAEAFEKGYTKIEKEN